MLVLIYSYLPIKAKTLYFNRFNKIFKSISDIINKYSYDFIIAWTLSDKIYEINSTIKYWNSIPQWVWNADIPLIICNMLSWWQVSTFNILKTNWIDIALHTPAIYQILIWNTDINIDIIDIKKVNWIAILENLFQRQTVYNYIKFDWSKPKRNNILPYLQKINPNWELWYTVYNQLWTHLHLVFDNKNAPIMKSVEFHLRDYFKKYFNKSRVNNIKCSDRVLKLMYLKVSFDICSNGYSF